MPLRRRKKPEENEDKVIEISAQMEGTLTFNDPVNLKINGDFTGTLETHGTLTIGQTARIEANIKGDNIVIAGNVTGDIYASKMLVLMPTSELRGNITTPKLNIVEGATFQGHCQMSESSLLGIEEVSKYLEINIKEIEDLANSGKIPGTKQGDIWKFDRSQIDHWASTERVS